MKSEGFVVSFVFCSAGRGLFVGRSGYDYIYKGISLTYVHHAETSPIFVVVPHILCFKTCSATCFAKF